MRICPISNQNNFKARPIHLNKYSKIGHTTYHNKHKGEAAVIGMLAILAGLAMYAKSHLLRSDLTQAEKDLSAYILKSNPADSIKNSNDSIKTLKF